MAPVRKSIGNFDIMSLPESPPSNNLKVLWYFEPLSIGGYLDAAEYEIEKNETIDQFDPYEYTPRDEQLNYAKKKEWGENLFMLKELKTWLGNYWGKTTERTFKIPFWKADKLIHKSFPEDKENLDKKALALWVTDIDDPEKVDAGWMPYNEDERQLKKFLNDNILEWRQEKAERRFNNSLQGKHDAKVDEIITARQEKIINGLPNSNSRVRIYRLDPYFFKAWPKSNNNNGKSDLAQREFKAFKGYIKHKVDDNEIRGDHPYEDLYLVGRIVKKDGVNSELGVVIMVGAIEYQIHPWTTDGPDGPSGGGAMP